ncbi:DeoR family transcriptional regulator [Paenibacillus selenitireducens]|uniref:DeoR family transcriptional regulator n=1 Tax=Paenibacillus selenitireducens TaxID=1324314 RepID=A0A1T2XKT9_9BACL|nr:DeoR/GlpR family DNA-binding transcription regulator [Paenibacillus selenitireducens]OPA80487.1 DeoR family transcriptional regulator [Paenibacillus selenitireducens]
MLVAERYDRIVQWVNERGSIRVTELSELCQVTEETIRRDLDRLESAGRLRRSHGGAVSVKDQQPEIPFFEREVTNAEEKKRIAQAALQRIQPNDRIILDASTTAWYMACMMPDIPLTVLTNSIKVATELSSKEKIQVISTGGILASKSLSFVGPLTERTLEAYHVDTAFISCKGIRLDRGLSESNELQAMVKRTMISISDQVIVLADSSKFGIQAFTRVGALQQASEIITDSGLAEDILTELQEQGIPTTMV